MTFADEAVKKALGGYALAWKNITKEDGAGASFQHETGEEASELMRGIGNHNVQLLFLTPKGELLHVLAGYWDPKDLCREIEFVTKKLIPAARDGREKVAECHLEHAKSDAESLGSGACSSGMGAKDMKWLEDTQ